MLRALSGAPGQPAQPVNMAVTARTAIQPGRKHLCPDCYFKDQPRPLDGSIAAHLQNGHTGYVHRSHLRQRPPCASLRVSSNVNSSPVMTTGNNLSNAVAGECRTHAGTPRSEYRPVLRTGTWRPGGPASRRSGPEPRTCGYLRVWHRRGPRTCRWNRESLRSLCLRFQYRRGDQGRVVWNDRLVIYDATESLDLLA